MTGSEVRGPESEAAGTHRTSDFGLRTSAAWAAALRDALLTVMTEEDVDISVGAEPGVLEVSTNDWTLRIDGLTRDLGPSSPVTTWVAIDDEPDDPARYRAARRAVMSPPSTAPSPRPTPRPTAPSEPPSSPAATPSARTWSRG